MVDACISVAKSLLETAIGPGLNQAVTTAVDLLIFNPGQRKAQRAAGEGVERGDLRLMQTG
jgi:hypothetical protein